MRLSAFSVLDAFPVGLGETRDRIQEAIDLGVECEASGLDALWIAEHHFHAGGLCPSPPVLLSALGGRTDRLRLGVMVSVLPFHDPVDLAEQYGLLDQLTRGRLNLGVGSGYIGSEFEGFHVDPGSKRERFDSSLETLLAAFRGEPVRVGGKEPGVTVNVRPIQRPYPPITVAVQRREAVAPNARLGRSIALIPYATVASMDELEAEIEEFRAARPPGSTAEVRAAVHVYAGASEERAREALQRYLDSRLATQSKFYEEKVQRDPNARSAEAIIRSGLALVGPIEEVARGLARLRKAGVDELLGIFDFGGLPIDDVRASVRAVAGLRARLA